MFSQTVEYILRVVVFLASQKTVPATTQQISDATSVPIGYLAKIMQRLVKAEIVSSQRGRNGGFLLHPRAFSLTLFDVIQGLEPLVRLQACPRNNPEHATGLCPLHRRLDQAIAAVEATLRESTLDGLVEQLKNCQVGAALLGSPAAVTEGSTQAV
jgi:Rrf2 family protein